MVPRLFVAADLAEGAAVGLAPAQAHYLRTVLRRGTGAPLLLFNGRDGEWAARIDGLGKGWCSAAVLERRREQTAEPDLWLVFAPIKRARLDWLVEKATELGVAALVPVFTARTQSERVNRERLARHRDRGGGAERAPLGPEIPRREPLARCSPPGRPDGASSCATRAAPRRRSRRRSPAQGGDAGRGACRPGRRLRRNGA